MTTHLIVISDLHINSTVALCPPTVNRDDGDTYHASQGQRWLWRCWQEFIEQAAALDGRKVLIINGDLGELDVKRRSIQLVTQNKATVLRMIADTLDPMLAAVSSVYVIRGTPAHTGKSCWLEEAVAADIDTTIPSAEDIYSHWHYRGVCEGVRVDIAHHANMGGAPWSKKNAAMNTAAKIEWLYMVEREERPPHIALRAHNHTFADSGDNHKVRVLYNGCWSLATEYTYRVSYENALADIGGYFIRCENGEYQVRRVKFDPEKGRRLWVKQM